MESYVDSVNYIYTFKKKKQPFHALQISETVSNKEGKIKYYMNINNI